MYIHVYIYTYICTIIYTYIQHVHSIDVLNSKGDIPLSTCQVNYELPAGAGLLCDRRINKMNQTPHVKGTSEALAIKQLKQSFLSKAVNYLHTHNARFLDRHTYLPCISRYMYTHDHLC